MAAAVRAATITGSPAATSTIANWKTINNNKLVGLGRRGSGEKLGSPFSARLTHNSPPSFSSLSISPDASSSTSPLTSSIGSPPLSPPLQWNLDSRHILALNAIACVAAISASWLFFSAIPTLLSFKRAAESLEKLLDVTREELPDTMAAVRLSGMEISDLTMELSDLGQDITRGVRSSTRAVRLAEDRLRRFTTMAPTGANHAKEQDGGTRGS